MPELAHIERVVFLQSANPFALCRAEQILNIATITRERSCRDGETIFEADRPADELHCVVRGAVELEGPGGAATAGPTQAIGVREVLTGRAHRATARAVGETLLLSIDADDFFDLLANNIDIVKTVLRHCLDEDGGA